MSDPNAPAPLVATSDSAAANPPKARKKTAKVLIKKEKTKKEERSKYPFSYSGHVVKVTLQGGKAASLVLRSKKGETHNFALPGDDALLFGALVSLAGVALATGSKLHVHALALPGGELAVAQAELRAKR